jgi:pyrroloquinoline quinone biosynthesis protein B
MRVKILGSAAGGAFPQWNCACANCRALRAGTFHGKARSQTQVAISADSKSWFLLGASPDLRLQIESTPELHPRADVNSTRHSPIAGAVLLNADIDHVLGLLLLRELQPLRIYATKSVRRILTQDNSMFAMLQRVPDQASWIDLDVETPFSLCDPAGKPSGLECRAIPLGEHYPAYVSPARRSEFGMLESSLSLMIESPTGRRLAHMPAVPRIDDRMLTLLDSADAILFDGTFWTADELICIQGSGPSAWDMGHVPISSPAGSLVQLAQLKHPRKIYIHINNTNPMLNEASPEYRHVREAGWEIAEDGCQFDL